MIYQVRANLFFDEEPLARSLYNHCEGIFPLTTNINPDKENAEWSSIELIRNNHGTDPAAPCILLAFKQSTP